MVGCMASLCQLGCNPAAALVCRSAAGAGGRGLIALIGSTALGSLGDHLNGLQQLFDGCLDLRDLHDGMGAQPQSAIHDLGQ